MSTVNKVNQFYQASQVDPQPTTTNLPTSTVLASVITSHNLSLKAKKGQTIPIASVDYLASGGKVSFASLRVLSLPAKGTLMLNGIAVTVNQDLTLEQNGRMVFQAPANFADTTTFTYRVQTSGGNSATKTATITAVNEDGSPVGLTTTNA